MNERDIFYYAKSDGIPCYYQPETGETIPRNKFLWTAYGYSKLVFGIYLEHQNNLRLQSIIKPLNERRLNK